MNIICVLLVSLLVILVYGTTSSAYAESRDAMMTTDRFVGHISYENQNFTIRISPFAAKVNNFGFDPTTATFSWSLSTKGIAVGNTTGGYGPYSVADLMLSIPKSFPEFSGYYFPLNVTLDGITLPNSAIYIQDDFESKSDYGIFIDAGKAFRDMPFGNNTSNYNNTLFSFSLSRVKQTTVHYDELPSRIQALVSWNPNPPVANGSSTINIKFFTSNGTPLKNVVYDINMHDETDGKLEYRIALNATNGTDFQKYNFSHNGIYRMHLYVRGLSNSSFPQSIDYALKGDADGYIFVVPEFPISVVVFLVSTSLLVLISSR